MDTLAQPTAAASTAAASASATSAVAADRINELYRGEIFSAEVADIARERIHWMCSQCAGDTVLDVGCSQGITSILLAREGLSVTAIDTHPASIAFARNEVAKETPLVQSRLTLIETDLASLPAEPAFDTIVLGEVLEHQALPERFLRAAAMRAVAGGRLVLTTPFALHPHEDHKISVMPRHIVELCERIGLHLQCLEVVQGYIRAVAKVPVPGDTGRAMPPDLLAITESATLESQRRLFARLDERAEQLRKKTDALKIAQKKLVEATSDSEALKNAHAGELKQLLQKHEKALADLQAANAAGAGLREQADRALGELREAHQREVASLVASHHDALAAAQRASNQAREEAAAREQEAARRERATLDRLEKERLASAERLREAAASAERQVRSELESRLKARSGEVAALQGELATARTNLAELPRMRKRIHELDAEQSKLNARLLAERMQQKHRNDDWKRRLDAMKAVNATVRSASSYRLGRALIRGVKSPAGFGALPKELWSIASDALARRRARRLEALSSTSSAPGGPATPQTAPIPAPAAMSTLAAPAVATRQDRPTQQARREAPLKSAPKPAKQGPKPTEADVLALSSLQAMFNDRGLEAVKSHMVTQAKRTSPRQVAVRMLQLGKTLSEAGHRDADLSLADAALALDRSDATLRGYFWVAQRAQRFEDACATIQALEALYGPKPAADKQAVLDKLRVSPAYQLTLLSQVVSTPIDRIDSIPSRVCYVLHNSLPYSSGGYGTRSHGVATGLAAAGYEVVVLTRPGFPLDIKPELTADAVKPQDSVEGIPYVRTLSPQRKGLSLLQYVTEAADALEQRLREHRPALVVAASNHVTALPALIAARRLGLPFVYEVRGLWEITRISREADFQQTPAFAVQVLLESRVAQAADQVFTLTEPMREELAARGVDRAKIDLLPNSCDPTRFQPRARDEALAERLGIPRSAAVIGYIGTFVDYEGLEDLTVACALLKKRGIEFRLLLVGNENASGQDRGPITEQIDAIAKTEGFSDWLIMPGRVPHEEVESYYSLIDIAPFPRKPLPVCEMVSPMKPLEALAMEKAVVVSSVRALTEMIADGRTGRVFEKGNVVSLADQLQQLIADPAARNTLGKSGRRWVEENRTWNQVGQRFVQTMRGTSVAATAVPPGP